MTGLRVRGWTTWTSEIQEPILRIASRPNWTPAASPPQRRVRSPSVQFRWVTRADTGPNCTVDAASGVSAAGRRGVGSGLAGTEARYCTAAVSLARLSRVAFTRLRFCHSSSVSRVLLAR